MEVGNISVHNVVGVITLETRQLHINLQATKLFIVMLATKEGGGYHSLRFRARSKLSYRVIRRLIQHCLVIKMVYLNVKYAIATRSYEFFIYTQNLIESITLSRVIIPEASVN